MKPVKIINDEDDLVVRCYDLELQYALMVQKDIREAQS